MPEQYITKEGLEGLKKELDYLKTVKIREIAELIRYTASFGDLKENFAYHDAKEKQAFLQGKILELQEKINNAKIIENKKTGKIQVGSKVLISLNGEEEKIEIVGAGQADSLKGKISCDSPLGNAITDKCLNDEIKVRIGDNILNCKILKIE